MTKSDTLGYLIGEATDKKAALELSDDFFQERKDWQTYARRELMAGFGADHEIIVEWTNRDVAGTLFSIDDPEDQLRFLQDEFEADITMFRQYRKTLAAKA